MKVRSCWLTLVLAGTSIISVLPFNSSTNTNTFESISTESRTTARTTANNIFLSTPSSFKQNKNILGYQTQIKPMNSAMESSIQPTPTTGITTLGSVNMSPATKYLQHRNPRNTENGNSAKCHAFEFGNTDNNMLYSPGYPDNYPNNTDCVRVLEAPPGYLIRLDFRDFFHIEPSEGCKFDFLEIRDGGFGFSNLIGQYCAREFPPMVTSKERHLWLHFHSDENIEYSGFVAVYEFVPKPTSSLTEEITCRIETSGYEGFVRRTDVPSDIQDFVTQNKVPLDCMWVITVQDNWKIQLNFLEFRLDKPNECDSNFVDIFAEHTDIPSRLKNFCGSAADMVISNTNTLHVRFYAEPLAINSNFTILFTAFREKTASCAEDEYDCEDATCISNLLKCNGRNNCRFRWDEDDCISKESEQSEHVVIIIVVFALILGGMVVTFLFNCARKLLRDQKIIREHIRQSKESKLDEVGRGSEKRSGENLSIKLSPKEKHSQTSLQILDDVSNRYYREVIPISTHNSRSNSKSDHIIRQHHDIVVQTSLGDEIYDSNHGTCDTGCQTRESLFQPLTRQKSILSLSSQNNSTGIRFSTFGYDNPPSHNISKNSTNKSRLYNTLNTIEMSDLGNPSVPHLCRHHHEHQHEQQIMQQNQQQQQQQQVKQPQKYPIQEQYQHLTGKGKQKLDESKVFIDIRNSAPDVIIMTSH